MTREEILAMPAGRELDALVATKLMGLEVIYESGSPFTLTDKRYFHLPHYSADISAAWEVEEKMGNDELFWKYANHVKKQLLTRLGKVTEYDMIHAPADVRCKASLLAVME